MKIRDCMKRNVYSISAAETVREAVTILVSHHIGLLPVLDPDRRPVGVVGLRDLLNLALPSSFAMLEDLDYIGDFGALENFRPGDQVMFQPITTLMRAATVVREDSGLVRAYAIMLQRDLHDLPVVDDDGRLSGIASRVDIGTRILTNWT